jgi:hypothetical protein
MLLRTFWPPYVFKQTLMNRWGIIFRKWVRKTFLISLTRTGRKRRFMIRSSPSIELNPAGRSCLESRSRWCGLFMQAWLFLAIRWQTFLINHRLRVLVMWHVFWILYIRWCEMKVMSFSRRSESTTFCAIWFCDIHFSFEHGNQAVLVFKGFLREAIEELRGYLSVYAPCRSRKF